MFKRLFFGALLALALVGGAASAQSLMTDPYATGTIDSATMTINGGTPIVCALPTVTTPIAGVQPTCALTSITTAGTYTLVLTLTKAASCATATNAGSCTPGGSASSPAFLYTFKSGAVAVPVPRLAP